MKIKSRAPREPKPVEMESFQILMKTSLLDQKIMGNLNMKMKI